MKKFLSTALIGGTALLASASTLADQTCQLIANGGCVIIPPNGVPEIDAAGVGIAIALLGGIVALVRERRNRAK